jgi:hypothetical protein
MPACVDQAFLDVARKRNTGLFGRLLQPREVIVTDIRCKLSPQSSLSFFRPRLVVAAAGSAA